jgi:hypothetical protein
MIKICVIFITYVDIYKHQCSKGSTVPKGLLHVIHLYSHASFFPPLQIPKNWQLQIYSHFHNHPISTMLYNWKHIQHACEFIYINKSVFLIYTFFLLSINDFEAHLSLPILIGLYFSLLNGVSRWVWTIGCLYIYFIQKFLVFPLWSIINKSYFNSNAKGFVGKISLISGIIPKSVIIRSYVIGILYLIILQSGFIS